MKNLLFTFMLLLAVSGVKAQCTTGTISGHNRVCIGDTTMLYDTLVAGGSWTSSNTSVATIDASTGLLRGISGGGATITYTLGGSCSSHYTTFSFHVVAVPTLGAFVGADSVCELYTTVLNVSHSNVIWQSRNTSIVDANSTDTAHASIYANNAGSTTIVYTSAFCSFVSDSLNFRVNPHPAAPYVTYAGTSFNFCSGDTATFHAVTLYAHHWFISPATTTSTIDATTGFFTAAGTSGMATFSVYCQAVAPISGCVFSGGANLHIYPSVAAGTDSILTPSRIDIGETVTVTATTPTGSGITEYYYISSSSGASIATVTHIGVFSAISPGTVTVVHALVTHCDTVYSSKNITVALPPGAVVSSHFTAYVNRHCSAAMFGVSIPAHTTSFKVRTIYGDGRTDTTNVPSNTLAASSNFGHVYNQSGTYSIRQFLLSGSSVIDSVAYSYTQTICNDIALSFFIDVNSNCIKDSSSESLNPTPFLVEVDSNGVAIDTLSVTSGLYYPSFGAPGDIYSFKAILRDSILRFSCPSSGIIYDTLGSALHSSTARTVALNCASGYRYDLTGDNSQRTGRHMAEGHILVKNMRCAPHNAVVTMNISPKYVARASAMSPSPTSISGNIVTWNFSGMSSMTAPVIIDYGLDIPTSTWLIPGDTVKTNINVAYNNGDADTFNNVIDRVDTVKSSFDPNYITVMPEGNILKGTKLHYAIEFENDGNDTAQNIYVMDTLSDYLDAASLRLSGASAPMNITMLHADGHTIARFDFPGIKLADSSHHGHCTGLVMYTINAKRGLSDGTAIYGHAGIFFDDNPVVLTNVVTNNILTPAVTISAAYGDSVCPGATVHFSAAPVTVNTPHYRWFINSTLAGTDSSGFTTAAAGAGDSIKCLMTTIMDDTVRSTSGSIVLRGRSVAVPGTISGPAVVCIGTSVTLTESVTGGTWSVSNSHASIAGGVVHSLSVGADTVMYTVTASCGQAFARAVVTVNPLPAAGVLSGPGVVCAASSISVTPSVSGGVWSATNTHASVSGGVVSGISAGADTIKYSVTNSCGTAVTNQLVNINPLPYAGTISGMSAVCQGASVTLSASVSGGSWSVALGRVSVSSGVVSGILAGGDSVYYSVANSCGTATAAWGIVINPIITPVVHNAVSLDSVVCDGSTVTFTATAYGGGSLSYIEWLKAGVVTATGTTYSYIPANGDAISCRLASNAACRVQDTVASETITMAVNTVNTPVTAITVSTGDSIVEEGRVVTFTATLSYCGPSPIYQWYLNGAPVSGATATTYSLPAIGGDAVSCIVSCINTCVTTPYNHTNTIVIHTGSLGINGITQLSNGLSVFPNPTSGDVTISGIVASTEYRLLNVAGTAVQQGEFSKGQNALSLTHCTPGIYMLELTGTDGQRNMLRVVKE